MRILIIGFQRSGTTLLRRIMNMHPDVRILHEEFLLTRFKNKNEIEKHLAGRKTKMKTQNWGDKTPYYPNIRKIPVDKYCQTWIDYFGEEESRIIHTVRHPYDVVFSNIYKYPNQSFGRVLNTYRRVIRSAVEATLKMPQAITFKYEDLVLHPDEMVPKIYKFCGINHKVDFRNLMKKWENSKYQSFDTSRVFAYKGKEIPPYKHGIDDVVMDLNNWLGGTEYNL